MPIIDSINSLEFVLVFLVPGLVALYARSQFLTGRQLDIKEAGPVYLILTLVYYGLAFPFVQYVVYLDGNGWWRASMWMLLIGLGPFIFGSLLGIAAYYAMVKRIASYLGISLVHPVPTAWDYKLSQSDENYVFVTLKDGTKFAGLFGRNSFASTDPSDRDLYLEQIFDWHENKPWEARIGNGVWLTGSEISSIEFK